MKISVGQPAGQMSKLLAGLVLAGSGLLFLMPARAYLLDKDPDANPGDLWERVEQREYQLRIGMGGGAALYPADKYDLPVMPSLILIGVPGKGNIGTGADLGNGRGGWSKIQGQRRDTGNATVIAIAGLFFGLQIAQNITADEDTLGVDYQVRVATPILQYGGVYFGPARFERRPEGLPFTAETQGGKKTTGDLCQPFEKIKNLKRLETRTARKIIVYDFGAESGVELESAGTPPGHPTAALLSITPKGVHLDQPGATFGYRITITISPAP